LQEPSTTQDINLLLILCFYIPPDLKTEYAGNSIIVGTPHAFIQGKYGFPRFDRPVTETKASVATTEKVETLPNGITAFDSKRSKPGNAQ